MTASREVDRKQINISEIRDELDRMWAAQAKQGETVLRATTHNLIVVSTDSTRASETMDRVIELTAVRPGRVILVNVEPGAEERLNAWVSIYCRPSGDRQVCGELVTLAVRGALRDAVDSTVMALLAPDLPVHLWWTGKLTSDDHLFQRLGRSAGRVIADSGAFSSGADALKALATLPPDLRLSDLNWARLTPWRRMVSRLWEAPGLESALDHLRTVDLHYAASGGVERPERALLLVGWLADRLGWELVEASEPSTAGYLTRWRSDGWEGEVKVVKRDQQGLAPGEISEIIVQAGALPPYASPHLTAVPELACVETRLDTAAVEGAPLASAFQSVSTSAALAEELEHGYDPLNQRALARAAEIIIACSTPIRKAKL